VTSVIALNRGSEAGELRLRISVLPDHSNSIFFLAPPSLPEAGGLGCLRDGPIIGTELGSPELREDGLQKLTLLRPGEGFSGDYRLDCDDTDLEFVNSMRVRLFFILDRVEHFEQEFAKLDDTGFVWSTEVGSPIWCEYMRHLVIDEVTIPIPGSRGPC
jgi:hypothetical protein